MNARPIMVGRVRELEALQSSLSQVISGKGKTVMISGEAGIGKTKMTEELERLAKMTDCLFLVGRCMPNAPAPYLPFRDALHGMMGDEPFVGLGTGEVMFQVREALGTKAHKQPIILVLEDLHWADSASVQVLHFLARNIGCTRVLIVGTFRPEDISFGGAEGLSHPLFDSIRVMRREAICTELSLDELSEDEVSELLNTILGGRVHKKVLEAVMKEGEGNPLFTIECVHNLLSHGELRSVDGVWSFVGNTVSVPVTVKEVMMRRIDRLPKNTRRVLEAASVIGLRFEPRILATLMNTRQMDLLEILEDAERTHAMVKECEDGPMVFAHENLQRVLYESISEARRNEIHKEVARILEGEPRNLRVDGEIAIHHRFSGNREKCVRYSLSVGMEWLDRKAIYEAVPNFRRVLDLTKDDDGFLVERLQALEGMGDCQVYLANFTEGLKAYEEFMELGGEDARCARIMRKMAECWSPTRLGKGSSVKCLRYLDEAERCPRIPDFEQGEILGVRTNLALWSGDFPNADDLCARSEECFSRVNRDRMAQQLCYHAWIHLSQGEMAKAMDTLTKARETYGEKRDLEQELEVNRLLGEVLYHQGRGKDALMAFDAVHHAASQIGDRVSMCWSHIFRTFVNLDLRDHRAAIRSAKMAMDEAMESDSAYMGCMANTVMALVAMNRRDLSSALEFSERAWTVAKGFPATVKTPVKGVAMMVRGAALSLSGMYEEGNAEFEESLQWLDGGMGCMVHLAFGLCYYGESLQRQGLTDKALECYDRATSIFRTLGNTVGEERSSRVANELRRISSGDLSLEQASNLYGK